MAARTELPDWAARSTSLVANATLVVGDLPAQALHLGGLQRVQRPGLGRDQQA